MERHDRRTSRRARTISLYGPVPRWAEHPKTLGRRDLRPSGNRLDVAEDLTIEQLMLLYVVDQPMQDLIVIPELCLIYFDEVVQKF